MNASNGMAISCLYAGSLLVTQVRHPRGCTHTQIKKIALAWQKLHPNVSALVQSGNYTPYEVEMLIESSAVNP